MNTPGYIQNYQCTKLFTKSLFTKHYTNFNQQSVTIITELQPDKLCSLIHYLHIITIVKINTKYILILNYLIYNNIYDQTADNTHKTTWK